MSEGVKAQIYTTLLNFLGYTEEVLRKTGAGCLGAICKYLSPEQLDNTLSEYILSKYPFFQLIYEEIYVYLYLIHSRSVTNLSIFPRMYQLLNC